MDHLIYPDSVFLSFKMSFKMSTCIYYIAPTFTLSVYFGQPLVIAICRMSWMLDPDEVRETLQQCADDFKNFEVIKDLHILENC